MNSEIDLNATLWSGWQKGLLHAYGLGWSDAEVKMLISLKLGIGPKHIAELWNTLLQESKEFSQVIETGQVYALAWWESQARLNLHNPRFNTTGWFKVMKNRFGWKDKQEVKFDNKADIEVNFNDGLLEWDDVQEE